MERKCLKTFSASSFMCSPSTKRKTFHATILPMIVLFNNVGNNFRLTENNNDVRSCNRCFYLMLQHQKLSSVITMQAASCNTKHYECTAISVLNYFFLLFGMKIFVIISDGHSRFSCCTTAQQPEQFSVHLTDSA